jgi:hypothetical protein
VISYTTTRVVYVDNDLIVLAHSHQVLRDDNGNGRVDYLADDIRNPASILERDGRDAHLTEPIAVLLIGVLHFLPDTDDEDDPYRIVAQLVEAVPSLGGALPPRSVRAGGPPMDRSV